MGFDPVSYAMGKSAGGSGGGGGSSTLSGLTDVDISNPTNGQTLVYNATSGKWENGAGGSGGGSGGLLVIGLSDPETFTLDKTWKEIYESDYAVIRDTTSVDTVAWETVTMVYIEGHNYVVQAYDDEDYFRCVTDSENGYPVYVEPTP